MIEAGPRQAIIERICSPLGGLEAQENTLYFWSSRLLPDRQLHEVTFVNNQGQPQKWIYFVTRKAEGVWQLAGEANITSLRLWPWGDDLWVHFSGGNPNVFWLRGSIHAKKQEIVRVRLISKNGHTLEDQVQDGQVFFLTDQKMSYPIQVEFYDQLGNMVKSHPWAPFP